MIKELIVHKNSPKQTSSEDWEQFFDEDGHLNDAGITLYTEALLLEREDDLPQAMIQHLDECPRCQHQVYEFCQWMESEKDQIANPHPFLDRKPKGTNQTLKKLIGWTSHLGKVAAIILFTVVSGLAYLIVQQPNAIAPIAITSPFDSQDINVAFREWQINNEHLRVLYLPNGGSIHIPAHTFVNQKGNPVTGNITLLYREFQNPSDIIASGIPMEYDSAGVQQYLETCGMFEIRALQKDEPLSIAPDKSIEVHMASSHYEPNFSHYRWQENNPALSMNHIPFVAPAHAASPLANWEWVGKPTLVLANYVAEQNKRLLKDKVQRLDSLRKAILHTQEAIRSYQQRAESTERAIPQNAPNTFTLSLNIEEDPGLKKYDEKIWEYAGEANALSPTRKNYWVLQENWDQLKLKPLKYKSLSLKGHQAAVNTAYFSPNGQLIITASTDHTAKIWTNQAQYLYTLEGHRQAVNSAVFSPDGAYILTASDDHTAKIWHKNGQFITSLLGHKNAVLSASFSPNGQYILTSSLDHTVKLWNAHGQMIQTFPHESHLCDPIFSPNSKYVLTISSDSTVTLWNTQGKALTTIPGSFKNITFFPNSKRFITTSANAFNGRAAMWNIKGKKLKDFSLNDAKAQLTPDGQHLISHTGHKARLWYLNEAKSYNAVLIRNMYEEERDGHQNEIASLSFSKDGQSMVTASQDHTAKVWDKEGWVMHNLREHTDKVNTAVFSPNGTQILTASDDNTAKLWVERSVKDVYEMKLIKNTRTFRDEEGKQVQVDGKRFYTIVRPIKPSEVRQKVVSPRPEANPINSLVEKYERLLAEKKILEVKMVPVKATWLQTFQVHKLGIHSSARIHKPLHTTTCQIHLDWEGEKPQSAVKLFQIVGTTSPTILAYDYNIEEPLNIEFDLTEDNKWLLVLPQDRIASFSPNDFSSANWDSIRKGEPFTLSLNPLPSLSSKKEFDDIVREL